MDVCKVGSTFKNIEHYCTFLNNIFGASSSTITNGWLLVDDAEKMIKDKRLFFKVEEGIVYIICHLERYYNLYYVAKKDAVISVPRTTLPLISNLICIKNIDYSEHYLLMERSGFILKRKNVGMELILKNRKPLSEVVEGFSVDYANERDLDDILSLLDCSFDPILDDIPDRLRLLEYIKRRHTLVVRKQDEVVAALIRTPKGASVVFSWIATKKRYERCGLSWNLQDEMERICEEEGYKRSVVWINSANEKWIERTRERGYKLNHQQMNTYVLIDS